MRERYVMKTYRYTAYRQMSSWEATKAWSAKRKQLRQDFEQRQAAAGDAFNTAWTSQSSGAANIAVQMSIARMKEELVAKAEKAKNTTTYDTGGNLIPSTKNSTFSVTGSTRLDGGTQIDMNSNTMTLSNGTQIDIKTGLKKVSVTV
jgi:hypothetical protein